MFWPAKFSISRTPFINDFFKISSNVSTLSLVLISSIHVELPFNNIFLRLLLCKYFIEVNASRYSSPNNFSSSPKIEITTWRNTEWKIRAPIEFGDSTKSQDSNNLIAVFNCPVSSPFFIDNK